MSYVHEHHTEPPRKRNGRLVAGIVVACLGLSAWAFRFAPQFLGLTPAAYADSISPSLLKQIAADPDVPVAGNPVGAVTVTEFFDYRCPYCRMMQPRLQALTAHDKRVRLVFKEWPIFGGASIEAARLALVARWQGKYLQAHEALFALPRTMDMAAIRVALSSAGIDMAQLDKDLGQHGHAIDAQLAANDREARELGFQGTPGFVIGKSAVPGALSEAQLNALIDQAAKG